MCTHILKYYEVSPRCALPECRAAYAMEYVRDACTAEQLAQLDENMLGAPSDALCCG